MITNEKGLRFAKLMHVSIDNGHTDNSNKVYIMEELSNGTIECKYGRVGNSMAVDIKPASKWDATYKQKTSKAKGYTDVTEFMAEPVVDTAKPSGNNLIDDIPDTLVKELIKRLSDFANKTIQQNYKVTQDAVSEAQVVAAQALLSTITTTISVGVNKASINEMLLQLYTIIPRNMRNVKDYLLGDIVDAEDVNKALTFLNNEQATLDTMAGQVELLKKQKPVASIDITAKTPSNYTILDQMGITAEVVNDASTIKMVKDMLEGHGKKLHRVYAITNKKTQPLYDVKLTNSKDKLVEHLFHGSRNANWFNILQTGLMIRPSGAGYNGSMFDDGIYFANDADKSMGYTDGGRWAGGGNVSYTYLGVFSVHLGKQLHIHRHDSSCYKIASKVKSDGYDSVYAHKGQSLRKDELIIYNSAQCTVKYLVELKN
jgi:poly [ADP-ribose] polymerase